MGKISNEQDKTFLITLPGVDTETATPEQSAYHCGFPYEFIKEGLEGYFSYTSPPVLAAKTIYPIKTINHNLGYVPEFQVFVEDAFYGFTDLFARLPYWYSPDAAVQLRARVNTQKLEIFLEYKGDIDDTQFFVNIKLNFKYNIFVNQLNSVGS